MTRAEIKARFEAIRKKVEAAPLEALGDPVPCYVDPLSVGRGVRKTGIGRNVEAVAGDPPGQNLDHGPRWPEIDFDDK